MYRRSEDIEAVGFISKPIDKKIARAEESKAMWMTSQRIGECDHTVDLVRWSPSWSIRLSSSLSVVLYKSARLLEELLDRNILEMQNIGPRLEL